MKSYQSLLIVSAVFLASCSTIPKSYFTVATRTRVESKGISPDKLQYYVDRDIELRRELSSGDVHVSSGKIKFENGKYINIIRLKKFTEGVCTAVNNNSIEVSFELGDGHSLKFGVPMNAGPERVYQVVSSDLVKQSGVPTVGRITYDGETYYIQPDGVSARLMIKKSVVDKFEVKERTMKGRKINN